MKVLIIGGTLYFGKKLTQLLIEQGHDVTLLNRGNQKDGFSDQVTRIKCDRNDTDLMINALKGTSWDVIFDQVCYDYKTAKTTCKIFQNKTKHYIFTSSQSVYEAGSNISEDKFDPKKHFFNKAETAQSDYAEAKRQAEVAFTQYAIFPTSFIRFPIVLGEDDYTERLAFHIKRIQSGKDIYFKNLEAQISFISADDAAASLVHVANKGIVGAINCCNDNSISINDFIDLLEERIKLKAIIAKEPSSENISPYGIDQDWFMNSDKLKRSGLKLISVEQMLGNITTNYLSAI